MPECFQKDVADVGLEAAIDLEIFPTGNGGLFSEGE